VWFDEKVFSLSLLVMTVGDPMAAILGVYYKNSPKIYGEKNIAGSFGHGIFSMIVSLIYL